MIGQNNRIVNAGILLLAVFLFIVFVSDDSEAATYKVDNLGGSDYTNITQAVENASAGDTINIASRNYFDAVDVDKRLTITGGNYGVSLNNLYSYCYGEDVIGYYQFDNSGTYVNDGVWCENNYGYLSGAVRTSGFTGDYAIDFDGGDDYIAIDHDSVYNISEVSISAWINVDDNDTDSRVIFSNYQEGSTRHGYKILINSNAEFEFIFGFGSGSGACQSDTEITENNWTLVTATYDVSSIKLYINDELDATCNYGDDFSISNSDGKQVFGASDHNSDDTYDDFFDGTIDDLVLWKKALTLTDIENIFWGGNQKPRINASEGSYAIRLTVDSSVVRNIEVAFTGPDIGESSGDAGLVIQGTDGDPITGITISDVRSKYNRNGLRVSNAKDIDIYSFSASGCGDNSLKIGVTLYNMTSSNFWNGDVHCAKTAGYLFTSGSNNNILQTIQAYSCKVGFKVISNGNYFNNTYAGNNDDVGMLFYGSDNNQINDGNYYSNKYAVGFTRGAENNRIEDLNFNDNEDYDIHHGYDSNSTRNGWENILIDLDFDELYIDSASRLLEKTLVETTITDNGTYAWNRVNTTLDSNRKAYSGTNSFWAGDSEEDEYRASWNVSFKMKSDVSLPSGGLDESRILEIQTWYKTEEKNDGGRVYITKDSGSNWNLLTPLGGYDSLMYDGSQCDNDEKAFTGDESSWQSKKFNLSGYRGEDIRIKFVFCSDNGGEQEGWYIDDVKIYKDSDSTVVTYFDDFERLGHMWVDPRDWVHEGNPEYDGKKDADVIIIEGTSSEPLINSTINKDLKIHLKMDESGSSSAYDSISGQSWYRTGNTNYVSGLYGNAANFDGSGDYIYSNYNYMATPYYFKEITISSWVKFDDFPSSSTDYDTVVATDYDGQFRLQVNSSGNPIAYGYFYGSPSGEQRAIGDNALVTGVWYHLVGTWSENTDVLKLYINGTLVKTNSFSGTTAYLRTAGSYSYVGRDYNGHYMDGKVDNVQVWKNDLSAREVKAIYDNPISGPYLYSTRYFGGSDDKTDNEGKLDDIFVTTKIYDGSSSGSNVDTYIGIRYGDWTREIAKVTISDNKLEAKVLDFRVYNRNKENLYYSLSTAVLGASSGNIIEVWPGLYKENIVVNTKVAIVGSGTSRTIIDARYRGPAIKFNNYPTDYSSVKNLRVMHAANSTNYCQTSGAHGGAIYSYYSDYLTIQNVHFYNTYIGFMSCYAYNDYIHNSTFDRGTVTSYYSGIYIYGGSNYNIIDNEITKYSYGIYQYYDNYGSHYYNNYIHNNTNYGIYMYQSANYYYTVTNPIKYVNNSLVDNGYAFYRGDSSSNYGQDLYFKDNLIKSSSNYGIYCSYYCYDATFENNTFEGDSDTNYGIFCRYCSRSEFGNNTFSDHLNNDIYFLYCGSGANTNKFFYNTYSSISIGSSCQVDVYNNLNVKTVEEDSDPFANVEIEIKDSSNTFYETSHWGGSDALTDSDGFISSSMLIRSGYYSSSSTLTDNNITVNLAYGVRAKSTWILFDADTTKSVTVPDDFRLGVVKNTNTSTIYTSFSSAISAASTNNVLNIWDWTYNENFVVNKGVTIIGNSTASSIINGGSGDYAIEVKSNGVTIKNLTLNGASDSLLYAGNYDNLKVENVVMSSSTANYGIYFDRTSDTTITSVTVNDTHRKSVYITDGDTITFKNSYFMNASSSHGFEISDSEDIILDNVFIYNAGYNGSSSYGLYISVSDKITVKGSTKVGSSKSYELYVNEVTNLIIQNSTFLGKNLALIEESDSFLIENSVFKDTSSGDYGVYIRNTDSAIFKFNTILNSASDSSSDFGSIYLTSSSSNYILNNTVTNSGRTGIHLKSSSNDNKIYGNTVSSSYLHGLYVQSSDSALIRNNTFSSSGTYGIKVSSSDTVVIDNNTLSANSNYGLYISSADEVIIKSNTISDNQAGIYITGSDDAILSLNSIDDQTTYGVYLADSKRVKIKQNTIKNSQSDALVLSSNCDNAYIDNNTIKNNGLTNSGRAVKLYEVDNAVLYNNSITSNEYTGIAITASSNNKIIQNMVKGNGRYGIHVSNDFTKSANNTIKSNTINDNEDHGLYVGGIYTDIVSNTIKYNEEDGIHILDSGSRTTIQQNTIIDNEGNAIHVLSNHVSIKLNTINGDTSEMAILLNTAGSASVTNNTIEGGSQGIKVQNSTNVFIYNNTIESNSGYGIYLLSNSHSAEIKSNTVKDNENDAIYILSSNSADIADNTIEDNNGYGIFGQTSKLIEFKSNILTENDGGVKFSDCDYCNLTSMTITDNGGRGLWFLSGSDNNYIKHVNSSSNSIKDVYLQDSTDNTAFNFTFSTIYVNTNATLTITSNLEIVFQEGSGDGFQGIDFALLTKGVKVYSTPFFGGTDAVSDVNGEAGATFSLDDRIYNGSSTPDDIVNIIKYHYGVRSKEKSIDMSSSHTETISVPSYWVKGLVKNINSGSTWYKIQDAVDNASSGDTLQIWAWSYSENVLVDESITLIGNGTGNTILNATGGKGFKLISDDISLRNIKIINCGTTATYNGIQADGDDSTIENVIVTGCSHGISAGGSGVWIGNSTLSNNNLAGINVWTGDTSTTAVKIHKNTLTWNTQGVYSTEDDVIISTNIIRNNTQGIYLSGAADAVISNNTIVDNNNNIEVFSNCPRLLIKNNLVSSANANGMRLDGTSTDYVIIESNIIEDSGTNGIYIKHSDYFYLGNNTISGSGNYDLVFTQTSIGNSAKNTTFSTISIHANAYFAIYNDLTLKFMQNATVGFDELDVKLVSDSYTKYATSHYSGSDSKTNSNGLISTNFTLKFRIYDGTSTPDEATTTLYYHYGVRAKAYNVNMTTSHVETVSVPSYWKNGLVENLDSGLKSASIQDAIDNASSGDTLKLWSWNYVENDIEVNERVTIMGNSSGTVTISANWDNSVFNITTNTITLKNLTLKRSSNSTDEACIKTTLGTGIKIDNVFMSNCGIGILVKTSDIVISNVTIEDSVTDGIVVKNTASNVRIENSTIKRSGDDGIQLESNVHLYNNTILSNTNRGIYVISGSDYAKIRYNKIDDNDEQGIYIFGVHHVEIRNNIIEDNENYGIQLKDANYTQISDNTVDDNDGGLRTESTYNCNITDSTFKDNNGKGIWFTTSSNGNNIRDTVVSGSSSNDIELDDSKRNTGFNFTFGSGSIDIDSNSDFRVMNSLNIKFVNGSTAFAGVELELFNYDTVLYASQFYGGNDGASGSDGFIDNEFTVAYEIYNGSSTTEDVQTFLKYSYGVRGKTIEIDMSTSHTETVDVPSFWTKGLVRNIDTSTDYYKIQDAIDNASAEDTLHIWAWTYYENIVISKELTVIGNGTTNTTINGTFTDNTVKITADKVSLSYLSIEGGGNSTLEYYGIYLNNVEDVTIENLIINFGGSGLYNDGGSSDNVVSKTIIKNQADDGILLMGSFFKLENSTIKDVGANGIYANQGGDNSIFYNNTISDVYNRGIYVDRASDIKISYNTITDCIGANSEDGAAIWVMGGDDTRILYNNISNNRYGIHTWEVGSGDNNTIVIGNIIKDNDNDGVKLTKNSRNWQFWNNTITDNDDYDIHISSTGSTGHRLVNTEFDTIYVNSGSSLTIREYFVLDVNDASGNNMSGIDIKVTENSLQKYASSYFGGSDSKTDSYGTIATFLIDYVIYNGSSTPTTIPTYVSARSHDWVETFTSDPSSTILITVPDLRVQNTRTGTLTYHIQTSIDASEEGDTLRAWNGTYYENIEITEELVLKGNGTSTIINGNSGNAIEVSEDSITIANLQIVSSENGIYLNGIDDLRVYSIKFVNNVHGLYVEDSTNLVLNNSIFDVDDYGVYFTGTPGSIVRANSFRNGTDSDDYCIYQSESDSNGNTQIIDNTFNDCYTAWKSSSNGNTFRDNTLKDNQYGILLAGTASHDNLIKDNTFDDSDIAIYIYNTAHDNTIFENYFDDSDNYDIKLSDSYDTVSYNNTFSSISVASDANMWIKVYIDVDVTDNSSNALSNVDLQIKQDALAVYSTAYFGGGDSKTNTTGEVAEFLVAISQYNGSSTPTSVITTATARYSDWISSGTYNINNDVDIKVDDFRVKNEDSDQMFYSIGGAISSASNGDTLLIWAGTYYENIVLNKELTLTGNGTSATIINGSYSGNVITVSADEVEIEYLSVISSAISGNQYGLFVNSRDCTFSNLNFDDNTVGYKSEGDFNQITDSTFSNNIIGASIGASDNNIISDNDFSGNTIGVEIYGPAEDNRVENNEISGTSQIGIYLKAGSEATEETSIKGNYIHNNSGVGIHIKAHDNEIFNNILEYNSDVSLLISDSSGNNSIHNNTFKSNDDSPVKIDSSYYNILRDNDFISSDDYFILDGGGYNTIDSNTFDDTGILLENSNNQIIKGNTITDAPDNGIRIFKSSSNNYLSDNSISGSDDEDIYVGGSGFQINNRGFNNSFDYIKVQSNGEFVVLNYIGLRTVNSEGNMSGNDVKATFDSDILYASDYFDGNDPVTDSNGLIPNFIAPIEIYDGSSTPTKIITPMTVRFSDWVKTFNFDPYSGSSITVFVPDLRVKNDNTGVWSYLVQTSINNAGENDVIILSNSTYYENIIVHKAGITLRGPSADQHNSGVIIDAQDIGCAITLTKSGTEILGLSIINSFEWEDPFNSSGIRVLSDNNEIKYNKITESYVGILLESADDNEIDSNEIDDVDIGILLTKSNSNSIDSNQILGSDVADIQVTSFGYSSGSKNNYFSHNSGVELIEFTDSDSNSLNDQEIGTYNLENSKRISVYQSSYDYVICDSDSSLYLKNWININVSREDSPLSNVDIKIWDGDNIMYSTDYFGGANSKTNSQGKAPQDIEVIYRVFNGSSTATDNVTKVKLRVGDWFKTKISETDETRVDIDFDVPVFRITNQDTTVEYNYIQRAIDNASAGHSIFLSSGEYNEPIDITKKIILEGNGTSTIINGDGGTAIEVSEDSITIKNLKIISAEKGIYVNGTEDTVITNIKFVGSDYGVYSEDSQNLIVNNAIFDVDDYGIYLTGSSSVSVIDNEFRNGTESGDYCIYQSESSDNSEANIENNKFNDCDVAWRSGSSDNDFRNNTLKDNEYGVLLSGTESYQNLLYDNTFDDSGIAVYIYNTAHNNSLFNNEFDNSDDYDIKLSDSYDTVSYNNTFSEILVEEDANMWVKVDFNLIVSDSSSVAFLGADVEVKQDNLVVYSSSYFGGSDSKTDSNGIIETFLINYKEYNDSSTPTIIPTYVTIRSYDWEETFTSDPSSTISLTVPDLRVQNIQTGTLTYYIQTAIDDADEGDTINVWSGTYYENIEINKEIILEGNGTLTIITVDVSDSGLGSPPIVNSSREGINITADNVELRDLIISNFSIGIKIFGADEVYLSNIQIFDVDSDGIQVSGSEDAEIIGLYIESSSDGSGISVISDSDNLVMSDTVIIGFENGIFVNSYGASLENVTSSFNDNYGCYVVGTNIEISDSTFTENGINGIKLNALTSGILDNNLIFDNGNAEVRIISVVNIEMKDNSISDPSDGYGIHVTTSSGLDIHDNILNLTIWLDDSDFNTIRNNIFSSINGGSITYDDAAIVVAGSNNTISDNDIDDVGIVFAFLPGNHNYNTIENNTLGLAGYDIEYYTTGQNNTFINTDIGIVDISEDSYFEIIQFIDIEMLTLTGPADGVELEILEGDNSIYSTEMYGGSDAKTDTFGTLDRLFIISKIYDGVWVPEYVDTFITYYYDGAEYNKELDISILQENSHLERIWVNLRPISVIADVNGIGDNLQTGVEEAVKGADQVLVDQYTIAYWPFDEGTENNVIDSTGNYTGTILPIGIWNDGRPNSTADTSVEFDGTFTNIDTNLVMDYVEFTVEIWFKTEGLQTMTLISDKDNPNEWGYNLYIDNFVQFDFTIDGGQRVGVELETSVIDGEWHFVTVVRGEDYVRIWLDDEYREKSWSGEIDFTDSNIRIGQTPLGGDSFGGLIDDLRFSSIARHEEDFMIGGGIVEFISDSYDIDGNVSEHLWSSSLDGDIGEGRILYYPVEYLTEGSHTIYLSIVDDNGTISDTVSSVLVVMQRPDSQILSLKINGNSEAWGWQVKSDNGDLVEFTGGTGSEQFISAYLWVSSIDGVLYEDGQDGTSSFSTTLLSNGTHTISFSLRGGNGLWSTEVTFDLEVNGRPEISESAVISENEITRFRSAMVKVKIIDDTTLGEELDYVVSYRVKGTEEWFEEYIHDVTFNGETEELEFIFTPDGVAAVGNYEFSIEVVDELGGVSDPYVLPQSIEVENNDPVIQSSNLDVKEGEEPKTITAGEVFDLGIDSSDEDGIVSTVIWYADIDGDGEPEEIGTGANFTFEDNNLPVGDNLITVRVLDNEGSYVEQTFTVVVIAQPIEESLVAMALEDFSNNLPLIASVGIGFIMVVGTIALRRNRNTDPVVEGLVVDDGTDPILASREPMEVEEWDIPTDAQGNALIIGEYMAKRRESYITHPNNDEVVDYLHNNRERFAISSYFDVPGDPTVVVTDWALPENLRGNVHLDSFRQQIVERITDSSPDKNFVIIGEPGVGKTVMLFEVFDRLMNKAPVGILSTDTIAKAHEMFGVRVFYDDIPENQKLVEALTENDVKGVIVSSREADWKALPTEMQAKFDRLTVPLFSELDMKTMIQKMMSFQSIGFNEDSVKILAEYAEGSPIYVWSMVREMMHRSVKTLTREYIEENSVKGMINYVAQLLQRLLKDGEEYRKGGLHALASLIFLSDHMEERYCNDYFFDAYVEVLSKYTEEKLDDKMNPKTLNLVLAYLPINDSVIRFPHDTWPDVLQGWGDMNPFSTELRMINRAFADSGIFQDLKKEVVSDVWNSTYERYKRTPSRQKNSFLALADTLFQNFTIDELKESGVDIDIVRQVASTYSHIPQAAKLISKIQAVLPQTVTRIINMQDLGTDGSHAPYKIQEMYLIYNDGRMLSSLMDEEAKVDSDIMSSMLTAINDFVKDSFQTTGNLGSIDYGENQIILERGKHIILASVVYGEANRDLRSRMNRALTKIEDEFGSKLKSWDGDVDSLSGTVNYLQPIMDISKPVTKSMIDELQALKSVNLRSSWTQVAGFFEVNLLLNNYSKKAIKGAKLTLEYGSDFIKLVKTEPNYKYKVNEVDIKKIPANAEMSVTLYFEPLKSVQASLNVHLDYDSKGGNASGVSSAVFERVDLFKEGVKLNLDDINNAARAEVVASPQTDTAEVVEAVAEVAEVIEAVAEVAEVVEAVAEVAAVTSDVEVLDAVVEEADSFDSGEAEVVEAEVVAEVIEEPEVPAMDPGDSGVDDILSKLSELDDPENAPKKKEKKSEEDEDKSGMDDLLGKLDEL